MSTLTFCRLTVLLLLCSTATEAASQTVRVRWDKVVLDRVCKDPTEDAFRDSCDLLMLIRRFGHALDLGYLCITDCPPPSAGPAA
jgi:hypothetical protein